VSLEEQLRDKESQLLDAKAEADHAAGAMVALRDKYDSEVQEVRLKARVEQRASPAVGA
jgi:Leu/Phe-tRNA-protein transferase